MYYNHAITAILVSHCHSPKFLEAFLSLKILEIEHLGQQETSQKFYFTFHFGDISEVIIGEILGSALGTHMYRMGFEMKELVLFSHRHYVIQTCSTDLHYRPVAKTCTSIILHWIYWYIFMTCTQGPCILQGV